MTASPWRDNILIVYLCYTHISKNARMQPSIQNESNFKIVTCPRSRPRRGSWTLVGSLRIRTIGAGRNTDRGHRLQTKLFNFAQFQLSINEVLGSNDLKLLKFLNCVKRKWSICVSRAKSGYIFVESRNLGEIHWWSLRHFFEHQHRETSLLWQR